jgi:hypothetical protein
MTKLPPPEQWAIVQMSEIELAEEIEKFIEYVDNDGRSVHLPTRFVRHYMSRDDRVLHTVVAIATSPIILADGGVLALDNDIDPERGIEFRIPKEVLALLPHKEDCGQEAVKQAMRFLTNKWLCDVLADYPSKCAIIAAALIIIERSLLPDRPVFFVTSGRRGAGKTTLITMLIMAVTGIWPAASAWSSNEEERRKALLSYFMYGVPYILWDNIPRGAQISCPHIEKSCTSASYADRKLGVSEMVRTAASTIHLFTGNNIGPRGDLASRSLHIRLEVDRPDPENRNFRHPDPIAWTTDHRAEILRALYTILIGNPTLDKPRDAPMKTRFKMWYRLIGSAVEYAARQAGKEIDFQTLFRSLEEEDVEETSLAQVLTLMLNIWPKWFNAQNVCNVINDQRRDEAVSLRDFFCFHSPHEQKASAKSIGWKLKQHVGEPVLRGERTLVLKSRDGRNGKVYWVEEKGLSAE